MENKALEDQLISEFEEIRAIEREAQQVSTLLTTFAEKVAEQSEVVGDLVQEAQSSVEIVQQVPEELRQAAAQGSGLRGLVGLLVGLAVLLLAMDWLS